MDLVKTDLFVYFKRYKLVIVFLDVKFHMKNFLTLLFIIIVLAFPRISNAQTLADDLGKESSDAAEIIEQPEEKLDVTVHLFSSKTCPHCQAEKEFLQKIKSANPDLRILEYEVSNKSNAKLAVEVAKELEIQSGGVPVTVVGNKHLIGFGDEQSSGGQLVSMIISQVQEPQEDIVSKVVKQMEIIPVITEIE